MDKNMKPSRKSSLSVYLREDVVRAIDKWLEEKGKEIGSIPPRSSFIENAIMAKVEEYGLMDNTAQ